MLNANSEPDTSRSSTIEGIRFDQIGSLRRPDWLYQMFAEFRADALSADEVHAGQELAIRQAMKKQEELDLPIVTDGEFRRLGGSLESLGGAVAGFKALTYKEYVWEPTIPPEATPEAPVRVEAGTEGPGTPLDHRLPVQERLTFRRNVILKEYLYASTLTDRPVKVALAGPITATQRFAHESSRDVYPSVDEFLDDVVEIGRGLIRDVVTAGCEYVQIDEPGLSAYGDPVLLETMRARGEDPEKDLPRLIDASNALIADFPGVTFGLHVCRGTLGGRGSRAFHREGHYDAYAEQLFSEANFDRFLLEYDGEHAGNFEPLRFIPSTKLAILGLVSNHGPLETYDYLKERIAVASEFIDPSRLGISPRCGFDGTAEEDLQWAKLALVQTVASTLW